MLGFLHKKRHGRNRAGDKEPMMERREKRTAGFMPARLLSFLLISMAVLAPPSPAEDSSASQAAVTPAGNEVLEIKLFPEKVDLPLQGASVTALLVVRNASRSPIEDIRITPFYNEGDLRVESDPPLSQGLKLPPGGENVWAVKISNSGGISSSENLLFLLRFTRRTGPNQAYRQSAYGILPVAKLPMADIAEVTPKTALESLDEQHPGKIYLIVANKINRPITVDKITAEGPDFVIFHAPEMNEPSGRNIIVPPFESRMIPIEVKTQKRVQPGKHILAFTAQLSFEMGGRILTRNVVLTQTVDVGVLGESMILKLLSVPSFFLIPGILALITWGLLWKWGFLKLKNDKEEFLVDVSQDPKSLQFWVMAVTVSILVILAYRFYQPGVLTTYGLADFVYIWFLSVLAVGFGGYLIIVGWRRRRIVRRTPSAKDNAITVIEKLSRQGLNVYREKVTVTEDGKSVEAFLLQEWKDSPAENDTLWVGPGIQITWKRDASAEEKEKVDKELKPKGNAKRLAGLLRDASRKNLAYVDWKKPSKESTLISSVEEVAVSNLKFDQDRDCMIIMTTE